MSYRGRKDDVWDKADTVPDKNPDQYRQDKVGNIMYYDSFGKNSPMGWNIDHGKPQSQGGTHHLNNLNAINSLQNSSKRDTYPYNYNQVENFGVTRYDLVRTDIDKRSSLVQQEKVLFNYDGTVDARSSAVRSGDIRLNNDGSVNMNSKGVRSGHLNFK